MTTLLPKPPYTENPRACIRQLIFETGFDDFPYGMQGTGFLATCADSLFFVTAKHCLAEGQQETLRIFVRPGTQDTIGFADLITFDIVDNHPLGIDIAALTVSDPGSPNWLALRDDSVQIPRGFSLDGIISRVKQMGEPVDAKLCAYGFPVAAPESRIDLESQRIISQPMTITFRYSGDSDVPYRRLGSIEHAPLPDLNGMSGSPVFMGVKGGPSLAPRYVFGGLLVRASAAEVEYVSGELVALGLNRAVTAKNM